MTNSFNSLENKNWRAKNVILGKYHGYYHANGKKISMVV